MATISEPRPSILARTLASNLARAGARTDSLTMTPTRRGRKGATQTIGRLPKSANRAPASTVAASTRWGAILTLATRSPFSTTWPSNAVKTSSGSMRLSRSSSAMRTLRTPAASARRSTRLWTGPGSSAPDRRRPRRDASRRRPRATPRVPARGRVTGSPASAAASAARSSALEAPALGPALAGDRQVTRQDRPDEARRGALPRRDALDLHADPGRTISASRARAASIARRV